MIWNVQTFYKKPPVNLITLLERCIFLCMQILEDFHFFIPFPLALQWMQQCWTSASVSMNEPNIYEYINACKKYIHKKLHMSLNNVSLFLIWFVNKHFILEILKFYIACGKCRTQSLFYVIDVYFVKILSFLLVIAADLWFSLAVRMCKFYAGIFDQWPILPCMGVL